MKTKTVKWFYRIVISMTKRYLQMTFDMVNGQSINAHSLENTLRRRPCIYATPKFTRKISPTINQVD